MKKRKIFAALLASVLLFACLSFTISAKSLTVIQVNTSMANDYGSRYSTSRDDWFADGEITLKDSYIMPDIYNTGYVSDYEDLVDFGEKYPEVPTYVSSSGYTHYHITDTVAAKYNYVFEGFKIENGGFTIVNDSDLKTFFDSKVDWVNNYITKDVVFRDFYINAGSGTAFSGKRSQDAGRVIVLDGEIEEGGEAQICISNITVKRCFLHGAYVDTVKMFGGQRFESCYITDAGHNGGGTAYGGHPDHFQLTGDDGHGVGVDVSDVYLYGNRIDALVTKNNSMNSCILIQPEFGGGVGNIQIQKNWFNGGGVPIQVGCKTVTGKEPAFYKKVNISNNLFGAGQTYTEKIKLVSDYYLLSIACTFDDNVSNSLVDVGGISYFGANGQVLSVSDFATSETKVVKVGISNYIKSEANVYVKAYKVSSDGEILASMTSATQKIKAYVSYTTYKNSISGYKWDTFTYDMEPIDQLLEVDLSDLGNFQEGEELYVTVYKSGSNKVLRSDLLTWTGEVNENQLTGDSVQYNKTAGEINSLTTFGFSIVESTMDNVPTVFNVLTILGLAIVFRRLYLLLGGK